MYDRARAMALRLGERLLREAATQEFDARGLGGASGRALAFRALGQATNDKRYREAMQSQIHAAVKASDVPDVGLFTGISGLRGVAAILTLDDPRYQKLVEQCDSYVDRLLPEVASARVTGLNTFDVIAGWSGALLARGLAQRCPSGRLSDLLAWMLKDDARWRTTHPMRTYDPPENDLGLAHGLAGVLAAIALSVDNVDGVLRERLAEQSCRLASHGVRYGNRIGWPLAAQLPGGQGMARSAWCYGTPGVAAALYWTSRRLGDQTLGAFAIGALQGEATASFQQWLANDHALCHGTLGNAVIFASIGSAAGDPVLLNGAAAALEIAVRGLEADDAVCWGVDYDLQRRDLSNELEGAAGIALGLLTLIGAADSLWLPLHALKPLTILPELGKERYDAGKVASQKSDAEPV
jgi:lantibiotic modifying enzyme